MAIGEVQEADVAERRQVVEPRLRIGRPQARAACRRGGDYAEKLPPVH